VGVNVTVRYSFDTNRGAQRARGTVARLHPTAAFDQFTSHHFVREV